MPKYAYHYTMLKTHLQILKPIILSLCLGLGLPTHAQTTAVPDSVTFFGIKVKAPVNCTCTTVADWQVICTDYAISCQPLLPEEFERVKKETLQQLKHPKTIHLTIGGQTTAAYKVKFDPGIAMNAFGTFNGNRALIFIWLRTEPKTTQDLPEFLRQIISL